MSSSPLTVAQARQALSAHNFMTLKSTDTYEAAVAKRAKKEIRNPVTQAQEYLGTLFGAFQATKALNLVSTVLEQTKVANIVSGDAFVRNVADGTGTAMGVMGAVHTVELMAKVPAKMVQTFSSPKGTTLSSDEVCDLVKDSAELVESTASTTSNVVSNWVVGAISKISALFLSALGAVRNVISFFNAREVEHFANVNADLKKAKSKPVSSALKIDSTESTPTPAPKTEEEILAKKAVESQRLHLLELASNIGKLFIAVFTLIGIFFQSFLMPKLVLLVVGIVALVFTNTAHFYEQNMSGPKIGMSAVLTEQSEDGIKKLDAAEKALADLAAAEKDEADKAAAAKPAAK